MPTETVFDLNELADTYEIDGEFSGRTDVRTFMARRRSDGESVLISVATTPPNDEGNALSHLAADAKSLMAASHPNLVPVLDARWIGTDAFAIVTPKVASPTLAELLARRDEPFDYPRIATILREVNAALEWARGQKIVHRALDPEAVYVEPGSDSISLSFEVRPLPLAEMPGEEEDGRAIAMLARTMLTRSGADPERESMPLAELRPGLPKKVIEQTEALSAATPGSAIPDISGYIASIAMAEALKHGEVEIEKMAAKWAAEEREMREEIDRLRHENERIAAEHARQSATDRQNIIKDRERMERQCASQQHDMERALAKEREAMERALLRDRKALDEERAALAALREELVSQRELYTKTSQFSASVADTPAPPPAEPPRQTLWLPSRPRKPRVTRQIAWRKPVAAVVVLLIVATALFALGRSQRPDSTQTAVNGVTVSTQRDSAAGVIAAVDSAVQVPRADITHGSQPIPSDLVSGVASRAVADPAPYRPPRPRRVVRSTPLVTAQPRADTMSAFPLTTRSDSSAPRPDSARQLIPGAVQSIRLDSLARLRRDSIRRDTIRRDTIRRDTIPRDTLSPPPSS
jgi:hypothetical protein